MNFSDYYLFFLNSICYDHDYVAFWMLILKLQLWLGSQKNYFFWNQSKNGLKWSKESWKEIEKLLSSKKVVDAGVQTQSWNRIWTQLVEIYPTRLKNHLPLSQIPPKDGFFVIPLPLPLFLHPSVYSKGRCRCRCIQRSSG